MNERFTDSRYLTTQQYRNSANLDARIQLHLRFSLNPRPWMLWVFDQLAMEETASVLEVGCGTGLLWRENSSRIPTTSRIILTDISAGMVLDARRAGAALPVPAQLSTADAQSLPFASESFDAVIANHMLYHVPHRPSALSELRRVLKPGGRLFATTNGANHLRELDGLLADALGPDYQAQPAPHRGPQNPFDLDQGGRELGHWFRDVHLRRYEDGLAVTDPDALLAYIRSMRIPGLEAKRSLLDVLRPRIEAAMQASNGVLHISKDTGMFVALK